MALVQTHRFNWMGYEGTESEALNLALLRSSDAGNLRYSDYQQRQQVVKEIELRLKLIKRDLDLLPQEDILYDLPDAKGKRSPSPKNDVYAENILALFENRRKELQRLNVFYGISTEAKKFNIFNEPSNDEFNAAYGKFTVATRSLLQRYGAVFVSYIDGTEFTQLCKLAAHNQERRAALEGVLATMGVTLPPESAFDVKPIKLAIERRNTLRMKIDTLRALRDPTYAENYVRKEELQGKGAPVGDSEEALVKKLAAAQKKLHALRSTYNAQAYTVSQQILKATTVRPAVG